MSVTPNPCCDETKNRGAYTFLTLPRNTYKSPHLSLYLCIFSIFASSLVSSILANEQQSYLDQLPPPVCLTPVSPTSSVPFVHWSIHNLFWYHHFPSSVLIVVKASSSSIMKSHHCVISSIIQSSLPNHSSQNIVKKQNKKHSLQPPSPLPHVPLYSIHCHLVFIPTLLKPL